MVEGERTLDSLLMLEEVRRKVAVADTYASGYFSGGLRLCVALGHKCFGVLIPYD